MDPNTDGNPTFPAKISSPRGYVLSGKLMLSGVVVLFAVAIFILFLHLYVRWYVIRRHDRRRRRSLLVFASTAEDENLQHSSAARGLDKEVLDSLSVEIFSDDDDAGDAELEPECAVCLNEFGAGEKVRVLPRCGHRFHVDCIDMWFWSHSTCPLCRCAVEAVTPPTPTAEDDVVSEIGEVRIEIPEETGSTSTEAPVKLPGHPYVSSIRRFFIGELIIESADRATPPPPPPPPSQPAATLQ